MFLAFLVHSYLGKNFCRALLVPSIKIVFLVIRVFALMASANRHEDFQQTKKLSLFPSNFGRTRLTSYLRASLDDKALGTNPVLALGRKSALE